MSENIGSSIGSNANVVEQILEQGQRLRNAMVKSILDNDPFYVDVVDANNFKNTHMPKGKQKTMQKDLLNKQKPPFEWDDTSPTESPPAKFSEFLDYCCTCEICNLYKKQMAWSRKHLPANSNKNIEEQQLTYHLMKKQQARKVSGTATNEDDSGDTENTEIPRDITKLNISKYVPELHFNQVVKQDSFKSTSQQETPTETPKEVQDLPGDITKSIQDDYRTRAAEYFKYVNSMKITVQTLSLNQAGNRKVSESSIDPKFKLPTSVSHSYFVEYTVPEILVNVQHKINKSKIDTGLSACLFRICSKRLQNGDIYFKHTSIHDIVNLLQLNLKDIEIKFQVSCRTPKQKSTNILGYATFNMGSFEITKHLSYTHDFSVIHEDFVLGTLKMTLQLGCGRMYFGQEFVEFVLKNSKNAEPASEKINDQILMYKYEDPPSQPPNSVASVEKDINEHATRVQRKRIFNSPARSNISHPQSGPTGRSSKYIKQASVDGKLARQDLISSASTNRSDFTNVTIKENTNFHEPVQRPASREIRNLNSKSVLYGLIYVSEAQYFEGPVHSYLSCQVFCQGDTLCSRVVYDSKDPVFNFYQKVPFLYDDAFLLCMRDNSIVVDFWERTEHEDIAVGTSQLPLHQFFVTYRNRVIANTLLQNRLPVTISDWWEPICSPVNGKVYGQMKVLVAVGTADQIHNLEVERGLKDNSQSVTYVPIVPEAGTLKKSIDSTNVRSFKRPNYLNKPVKESAQSASSAITSVDKGNKPKSVQLNNAPVPKATVTVNEVKKVDIGIQSDMDTESQKPQQSDNKTQDMLEGFLTELLKQKHKNIYVESATNTETTDIHNNLSKNINSERQGSSNVEQSIDMLNQYKNATNTQLRKTSDLLDYLNGALGLDGKSTVGLPPVPPVLTRDENNFKANVVIEGALHLPSRRKCKSKKTRRKHVSYEEALPSTYVTFETIPGADLMVTPVVPRSTSPQWDFKCDITLPGEILTNSQKRLIFKVWRKNNGHSPLPNLQTDIILGFAALDLTVLLAGLPSLQGWFNIVDFSSKCNGQIKIHVTPLENISRFNETRSAPSPETIQTENNFPIRKSAAAIATLIDTQEAPSELLNRALKRKFTELEEITQRLRSRLADVTKDDSDASTDEFADEFERDLNTLCVEDDYNMIDLMSFSQPGYDLPKTRERESTSRPYSTLLESGANDYLLKQVSKAGTSSYGHLASDEPSIYSRGVFTEPAVKTLSDSAYGSTQISDKAGKAFQPFLTNNISSSSSNTYLETGSQTIETNPPHALTPGDKQLIAGRQRIDMLLEKLTLLAGNDPENAFPSRYVSGCSVTQETEVPVQSDDTSIYKELSSRSGLNLDAVLNPALFNQLCSVEVNSTPSLTEFSEGLDSSSNAQIDNGSSSNSLLTQFSTYRQAPEGAGNSVDGSTNTNLNANKRNV